MPSSPQNLPISGELTESPSLNTMKSDQALYFWQDMSMASMEMLMCVPLG